MQPDGLPVRTGGGPLERREAEHPEGPTRIAPPAHACVPREFGGHREVRGVPAGEMTKARFPPGPPHHVHSPGAGGGEAPAPGASSPPPPPQKPILLGQLTFSPAGYVVRK